MSVLRGGGSVGLPHSLVINLIMDVEDIQADFAGEEEIDAGKTAPRQCRVLFYMLQTKKKIVHKVFTEPRIVKPTARKWCVQPIKICKWRQQIQQDEVLPAYPYPCTVWEQTIIKTYKMVKARNEGRPTMTPNDLLQQLLPYIEGL
jgi:hypothetical protein